MAKLTESGIRGKIKAAFPGYDITSLRVYQAGANNQYQEVNITLTQIVKVKDGKKVSRSKGR